MTKNRRETRKSKRNKQGADASSPEELTIDDVTTYLLIDPEVFETFEETPEIAAMFDEEGRLDLPSVEPANTWKDAHRCAAVALDAREELIEVYNALHRSPRMWGASQIKNAREVDRLAKTAVFTGVFSEIPQWRRWDHVQRMGSLPFDFSTCMSAAFQRARQKSGESQSLKELYRARLASLAAYGCEKAVHGNEVGAVREKALRTGPDQLPPGRPEPPLYLINQIVELSETARFLAEAGGELRRGTGRVGDRVLWKLEALERFIADEIRAKGDFDDTKLPVMMRAGAQGEQRRRFDQLVYHVDNLSTTDHAERASAAFLAGAVILGWGEERKDNMSFAKKLAAVQAGARPEDEDTGAKYKELPALRWRLAINKVLYALGHNADKLGDASMRANKKAADAAWPKQNR